MNRSASTWYFIWPPMLFVVLFILVWELVVVVFKIPLYLLPAPHQVAEVLWNDSGRLLPAGLRGPPRWNYSNTNKKRRR